MTTATQATTAKVPRLEALTGLRWFAAFGVFAFHVRDFYPLPGMRDVALFGNSGVTFFFILSGFVLTWSFVPDDTAPRFYWRRFARIWPALAVSTALAVPVFYAGRGLPFGPAEQFGVLASLTLVQAWIPSVLFAGNPAAWSLSDEAFFYAVFPAAIRWFLRSPVRLLGLLALMFAVVDGAIRWWTWGDPLSVGAGRLLFVSPAGRLSEFLLGMAVAAAIRRGWRCPVPVWLAVAVTATGIWALWYWQTHAPPHPGAEAGDAMNQVTAPLYALLIAAVAGRDLRGRWMLLRSRPLVALGKWSYAFYLVHATVLYAVGQHYLPARPESWDNWRPEAIVLGLGIASAALLYAVVEHPIEKLLRRLLRRLPAPRRRGEGRKSPQPADAAA
ncbi:MAG TPA: acyltransferase [Kineosporiaceae bacterium]|nr:acyltransferase [Kineosporiaceae bacterium]